MGSGWIRTKNSSFCENSKKKKNLGGGGCPGGRVWGGVRVDVNEELKFLGKFKIQGGCE